MDEIIGMDGFLVVRVNVDDGELVFLAAPMTKPDANATAKEMARDVTAPDFIAVIPCVGYQQA